MKIKVSYEDRYNTTILDVPDENCAVWVEEDYRQRLETAEDKAKVHRRTPQEIMDEDFNKETFNSHQRETRRHVSLEAYDAYGRRELGASEPKQVFRREDYPDLYSAIDRLRPKQRELLYQIFWLGMRQVDVALEEGVSEQTISKRMARIYHTLKKYLNEEKSFR